LIANMLISDKYSKLACLLYLIAATVLFAYWLFPEDEVREFVEDGASRVNPYINIDINEVSPSFPPGVKFSDISFSYQGDPIADPDYIRVRPGLFSLLGKSPLFFYKSAVFGGVIDGDVRLIDNRAANTDVRISGLQLEGINFLTLFSEHRIKGLINGVMKFESADSDVQAESALVFSNIIITLASPVLGIGTIEFDTIEADLSATPRRVEVKACTLKGQEIEGEFTGNILVRQPLQMSMLNLRGFLKPQAALIKKVGDTLPLDVLMKKESGDKGFPIRLRGTFQEPRYSFR